MNVPNLDRIVEAHVPVPPGRELLLLRTEVLPHLRELLGAGRLRWYSFLLHPLSQMTNHRADEQGTVIHLRLEPADDLNVDTLLTLLPSVFQEPKHVAPLGRMAGVEVDQLKNGDWAHAWRMLGEGSEWVLSLIESHNDTMTLSQAVQFLHFITNPMTLGHQCLWMQSAQSF